jgi:glycosyltransferase involved in cell wall biosynthesis
MPLDSFVTTVLHARPPIAHALSRDVEMKKNALVFAWENFGPIHNDRCEALAKYFDGRYSIIGVEWFKRSHTYDWQPEASAQFVKHTLFEVPPTRLVAWRVFYRLFTKILAQRPRAIFLCHYEEPYVFFCAVALRLMGFKVFIMNNSKFDDYDRNLFREIGKAIMYSPYNGVIAAGERSKDYMRFLGFPERRICMNYNVLSVERIRSAAENDPAPLGADFTSRHFTIIARLVTKKNISLALKAYQLYSQGEQFRRQLHICGDGPLMRELVEQVSALSITNSVVFHGFLQTNEISRILSSTLALILPSIEEQYGNVVIEALIMGVPVLLSENCGARDLLVRSGVNGFVFEPDNFKGLAYFMTLLSSDKNLWEKMASATHKYANLADAGHFSTAVRRLIEFGGENQHTMN